MLNNDNNLESGDMAIKYIPDEGMFYINKQDRFFYDFFENRGFYFPKEILTRYFLSLKTKPFVILTGISGTGKTKIAQVFADYIYQDETAEEKEKRIAFISVRPDWMDNKGLLGFYNILDQKYHATRFLQLLIEAKNNPDKPHFVILDEMNLSKVEMYFSDFLSIMESRTSDNQLGEPLLLHTLPEVQSTAAGHIPAKLHIPQNVFFTGTVNVDETTYMFSPKVLDRANVIEFNDVDMEGYISNTKENDHFYLSNRDIRNELTNSDIEPFCSKKDYLKLKDIIGNDLNPLGELLIVLKKYNLHFGYRVINEVSRFVWLSREYLRDDFNLNDTLDIQILQKILPKFHGTQAKLEQPLSGVLSYCYENEPEATQELLEKAMAFDNEARYPRSAQKVARMISNLKTQGYTSFIE